MSFNPNKVTSNLKRGEDQALPSNIFSVMIGGEIIGSFLKVTGLEYSVSPFQIKEGGRNYSPHMRPFDGPGQHGELTLEWGAMKRDKMEAWIQSVAPGFPFRRNVFISHNHYDHLDIDSLIKLSQLNPLTVFNVPKGDKKLLYGQE